MALVLRAHAKINRHLDVGPRRRDGYHDLVTVFQTLELHDTLRCRAESSGKIELTITPAGLPTDNTNLIVRALELLKSRLKTDAGMTVHLDKKVPMGAGLGGGSSDAAAALWAGWRLWKRRGRVLARPSQVPSLLIRCARELGADVPFFLNGGLSWASGVGEKLKPLPKAASRWLVVVYPRTHVSTPEAYRLLDAAREGKPFDWKPSRNADAALKAPFNSFEPVICQRHPAIWAAIRSLKDLGCAPAMMSGSGSAVFGFVSGRKDGLRVAQELATKPWDIFLTKTI